MKQKVVEIVYYIDNTYGDEPNVEAVLHNVSFRSWLKQHNEDRVAEGEEPEDKSEFRTEQVVMYTK
jgi:hypothetical protein